MAAIRQAMKLDPERVDYKCTLHLDMRKVSPDVFFFSPEGRDEWEFVACLSLRFFLSIFVYQCVYRLFEFGGQMILEFGGPAAAGDPLCLCSGG